MSRFGLGFWRFQSDNWWFCVACREYLRSKLTSGDGWTEKSSVWLGFGRFHRDNWLEMARSWLGFGRCQRDNKCFLWSSWRGFLKSELTSGDG